MSIQKINVTNFVIKYKMGLILKFAKGGLISEISSIENSDFE